MNSPILDWQAIDTVLLDMDGTLLDRHFDDYFWEVYVPENYALANDLTIEEARQELLVRYRKREGTLAWTDLDFWSDELGLDIPALKIKVNHLIAVHPRVIPFLDFCRRAGKHIYLVTNAHSKTLAIKMEKTELAGYFDRVICAEEIGMAKEDPEFWRGLEAMLGYRKERTMLADDTAKVLASARTYGIGFLVCIAKPSSRKPVLHAKEFISVADFGELI